MIKDNVFTKHNTKDEMTDEQKDAICYKSKLLNKYFDTYEDMKKEEDAYRKANAKKIEEANAKREFATKIEEAYSTYRDTVSRNHKEENELFNKYIELRNEFIEKYGSFHITYTNKEPKVDFNEHTDSFTPIMDFLNSLLS